MPLLNDMSNFLKTKEDLRAGDIITFRDEGVITNVDFSKAKDGTNVKIVFQITVELPDGRKKTATLNKASRDALKAEWGQDTRAWINGQAKVNFIPQLSFGKMTDVLVLTPVRE
jgi:molybdopterin-binding protein